MKSTATLSPRGDQGRETLSRILKKRLTEAVGKPEKIFEEAWYRDEAFCRGFFDRCEDEALADHPQAFDLAQVAVKMAVKNGDRCLENRAHGVLSHAYIAQADLFWAGHVLELYRDRAINCCRACKSNFLLRRGDLSGEEREAEASLAALKDSLEEGGSELSDDTRGRILYPRSVAYHHAGQRARAIDDAGEALQLISLDSPQGFFPDILAMLVIYVGGGDLAEDARALDYVSRFHDRIRGLEGWRAVHDRRFWAEGQLYGRLGEVPTAYRKFAYAQNRLLPDGLVREALAVSLDGAQIRCRPTHLREDNLDKAWKALERCLKQRQDLDQGQRDGLRALMKVIRRNPHVAFEEIGKFRRSFIAPVPGQFGERIGPG